MNEDRMSEQNFRAELASVFWTQGGELNVGSLNVERIVLVIDGHGPMGNYDRVHVFYKGGKHQVFPAHNCEGFEYRETPHQGD